MFKQRAVQELIHLRKHVLTMYSQNKAYVRMWNYGKPLSIEEINSGWGIESKWERRVRGGGGDRRKKKAWQYINVITTIQTDCKVVLSIY